MHGVGCQNREIGARRSQSAKLLLEPFRYLLPGLVMLPLYVLLKRNARNDYGGITVVVKRKLMMMNNMLIIDRGRLGTHAANDADSEGFLHELLVLSGAHQRLFRCTVCRT